MLSIEKIYNLIWFGFPLTKLTYGFILFQSLEPKIDSAFSFMPPYSILAILGVISALAGITLARGFFRSTKIHQLLKKYQNRDSKEKTRELFLKNNFVIYIIGLGLLEDSAIFGLVSSLMSGRNEWFFVGASLCLFGWALSKPNFEALDETLATLKTGA